MPDLQSPAPASVATVPVLPEFAALEDSDYAFGCECANPALQIPQWGQDSRCGADAA
jgi:hypothetical protein